jgi:hypothetical protein
MTIEAGAPQGERQGDGILQPFVGTGPQPSQPPLAKRPGNRRRSAVLAAPLKITALITRRALSGWQRETADWQTIASWSLRLSLHRRAYDQDLNR